MLNLKPVSVSRRIDLWTSKSSLKKISIVQTKFVFFEAQRGVDIKSIFLCLPSFEWLRFAVQVRGD